MTYMIKNKKFCTRVLSLQVVAFAVFFALPALASDDHKKAVDILPKTTNAEGTMEIKETTHQLVRLTPDKSELIRLDAEAASIIVGNSAHINVIADSSKTLVLVPRIPGATHFTVLGKDGEIIMQRHVIVASPKEDYVRIKRTCNDNVENCQNTSVFFCPDMCHEIGIATPEQAEKSDRDSDNNDKSDKASDDGEGDISEGEGE